MRLSRTWRTAILPKMSRTQSLGRNVRTAGVEHHDPQALGVRLLTLAIVIGLTALFTN